MIQDNQRKLGQYRYGYQGQYSEQDEETSWNSFELRQYDGETGRWLSVDPYGQYASPYVAMGNAPNMQIDPSGGWSWTTAAIGAGVGAVGGAAYGLATGKKGWGWYALGGGLAGGAIGGASFNSSTKGGYFAGEINKTFTSTSYSFNAAGAARASSLVASTARSYNNLRGASLNTEVSMSKSNLDPYLFYFYSERNEQHAYAFMFWAQHRYENEMAAYLVQNQATNQRGILVLPWFSNEYNSSVFTHGLDQSGFGGTPTGYISDRDGNLYKTLGYVHTHPKGIIPSTDDVNVADYLGIPNFIISPGNYIKINPNVMGIKQNPTGPISDLSSGRQSLFNLLK